MDIIEHNPLRLTRAGVTMAAWGIVLLLAGIYHQYGPLPSLEAIFLLWGVVTLIGLAVQVACEIMHAPVNLYVWLGSLSVAWAFTIFVLWDNYSHGALYGDLPGVWLICLGVGYIDTARSINSRFVWIGVVHLVAGAIMELSAREIIHVDILGRYSPLIFGIVAGGTLIIASTQSRLKEKATQPKSTLSAETA